MVWPRAEGMAGKSMPAMHEVGVARHCSTASGTGTPMSLAKIRSCGVLKFRECRSAGLHESTLDYLLFLVGDYAVDLD